jgi:outer membrane receptor protein involved in Fe transport
VTKRSLLFICLATAFLLLLAATPVFAQGIVTGSIAGRVTDPSGAPVAGAAITMTNVDTGVSYSGQSNTEGFYQVKYLPTGTYNVAATAAGFQRVIHPNVLLSAASIPTVNFELIIGAVSQSITVSEIGAMVEAQTADRGNVVEAVRLDNFPSQTGNIFGLTFNTAGVQPTSSQKSYTLYDNANSSSISINGGQMGSSASGYGGTNLTLVDGVYDRTNYNGGYVGLIPSSESVTELKIVTNAYSAEYGNTTGGAIIAITKSGTNDFHGMAWDNTRVTGLAANQFERNLAGQPKLGVHFWQPGGAIGGPIKKNKLFFFYEMQSVLSHTPKSYIGQVPTQAQRNGDFSQTYYNSGGKAALQQMYDPWTVSYNAATGQYTRQPFANNIIPANRINPVAAAFWKYIPLPNSSGDSITLANNYTPTNNGTARSNIMEYVSRVDWNISDSSRITFRHTRNDFHSTDVTFFEGAADLNGGLIRANHNAVVNYTKTLSPTTVLDVRTGLERYYTSGLTRHRCEVSPAELGFSSTFVSQALEPCFPTFGFGGSTLGSTYFTGAGVGAANVNPDQMNNVSATLSKNIGRHTLKFGWHGLLERYYAANPGADSGAFSFSVTGTNLNPQVSSPSSGNPVASFLLGVGSASLDLNAQLARQNMMLGLYVQDDINVTPKLKVNVGLRWDWDSSLTDRYNAMTGAFDTSAVSPLAAQVKSAAGASSCPACANLVGGLTFPGVNGQSRSPYDSTYKNFGPRLGAAYALNSRTAIRAGWGIFYGMVIYDPGSAGFSQSTTSVLYDSSYMPINLINNPFPNGIVQPVGAGRGLMTNVGTSVSFVAPHAREPRSQQFSFDVQRELGWKTLLTVGYVYNGVSRDPVARNIDALTNAQVLMGSAVLNPKVTNPFAGLVGSAYSLNASTIAASSLLTPYPQFTGVTENSLPIGDMAYHALTVQANKRYSAGLSLSVAYTWSKHMGRYGYQNGGDPIDVLQKSLDVYDMPHLLVINEAWELPFGRGKLIGKDMNRVLDRIVSGWMINGNVRLETGAPYQLSSNAIPVAGAARNAPNQSLNQWVNPAAFVLNTNPYSLVGWSQSWTDLRLPWLHNTDLQLEKFVKITERVNFAFVTNWVNAFNHPQFWNGPGACNSPSASCFGKIAGYQTQTNLPRQIQIGGKVTF